MNKFVSKLLPLFLLLFAAVPAFGQSKFGTITAASTDCSVANSCVSLLLNQAAGGATITLTGTWSATLNFEVSGDNGVTWAAASTASSTTIGVTNISVAGYTNLRVRCNPFTSGTVNVTIYSGTGSVRSGSSSSGAAFANAISPATYGVKADVKMCRDTNVHTANTSTTVQCDTASFSAADVGKAIFGTCCGLQGGSSHATSVLQVPQGTILSVTDPTHVVVSIAATATSSQAGQLLLWGTNDNSAWDTAWTAATGTAGICLPIVMPAGMSFISSAKFLSTVCNIGITGPGSQGESIFGLGYKTSVFVVLPNFVAASCTGATLTLGNVDCFGSSVGFQLENLGIWGGEFGNQTSLNGKVFVNVGIDSYLTNVLLAGLASCTPGTCAMVGINFDSSGETMQTMVVDGFGAGNGTTTGECTVSGGSYNSFSQSFCGNSNGPGLVISNNSARLSSYNGGWGGSKASSTFGDVINFGFFNDTDGVFFGCTSTCANLVVGSGSVTKLDGSNLIGGGNAGSFALFFNNAATAKVYAKNSFFTGGAANEDIAFATAMGTFFDQNGNTIAHSNTAILPTCTFTSGGGTSPACALQAGSTNEKGTIIATTGTGAPGSTGTITLTFAGTFSGATGATPSCTVSPNDSGTAWGNGALARISTQSTTAPIVAWSNSAANVLTALATSSPFRIDYTCVSR